MFPNLTVVDHALVRHKLTLLRDRTTSPPRFRELTREIATLMAAEATRNLPLEPVEVETPVGRAEGFVIAGKKLVLVPILRAGLGMVDGFLHVVPSARIGHVGLYRDEATLDPVEYYFKVPPDPESRDFILLDPMLATGGSAAAAAARLARAGARSVRLVCIVAAPEGVRRMLEAHPDVRVVTAALDRRLNEHGFIVPGLGDAGDRIFGTK